MILFFADLHLGIKTYSSYDNKGLTTAEYEARKVLEAIYSRSQASDITSIICGGDFFHTNQPSSENISFAISWFLKMDKLNKPFYIIPGNHDAALYSNSLIFLNSLNTKNIKLILQPTEYKWNEWNLNFIPYIYSDTMKSKEKEFESNILQAISSADTKTIIISHIQECTAKIGTESIMISKGVDIIDINNIHYSKDLYLLSGHMHKQQSYKKGHMTVAYPGSCFYQDITDCNILKGFLLFNAQGNISFEEISSIRKFISIYIPKDMDYERIIEMRRLQNNSVIFLSLEQEKDINTEDHIKQLLSIKNCLLGNIKWNQNASSDEIISSFLTNCDPYLLLKEDIDSKEDLSIDIKKDLVNKGFSYLDSVTGNIH